MTRTFVRVFALVCLACTMQLSVHAEDIDLFATPAPPATDLPNVLIVLDNTANWNTDFEAEKAALVSVFSGLPLDKFRVGLMMYTETGSGNPNPGGAYVRAALRTMNATNRPLYASLINSFDNNGDKGNGRALGLAMAEAYRYYSAGAVYSGIKAKRDFLGNALSPATSNTANNNVYALPGNALASAAATTYSSPITGDCQKNFVIYIGNTTAGGSVTQDNTSDNATSGSMLSAAGGDTTQIPISPVGFSDNYANEWTRFMKASNLHISTYTVDVSLGKQGNADANTALLKSMASEGGGKYFSIDGNSANVGDDIRNALNNIFSEIQSVNSVFASVSLPVSVNTQGTYLNQVFIGMFRPRTDANPRWTGNLKQYKLGQVGSSLKLLDSQNASAINSLTGFISECAVSYWAPSAADTYWQFMSWPTGTTFCIPPGGSAGTYKNSNRPDGNIVEKGAQAYVLRSNTTRTMKTCGATLSGCTSLVNFDNTSVSQAQLGALSTAERDLLINWARGLDTDDENVNQVTTGEMRPSAHGDVVHSRPVAVNFGTDAAPQVVVFYGGNDGALRAVNGNRAAGISTVAAGAELWSFMPPEFYSSIKRLRDNTLPISYATGLVGSTTAPKPYGIDGPITAYKDASRAFIYAAMRRGGRSIYSFDVTDSLTSPTSPSLKWRIGCSSGSDADCTSDMSGIGQTWSSLKSFTTTGYGGGTTPLLIFGGGYDGCEDYDALTAGGANNNCGTGSKGHYVYVINADTGALVKSFDTGENRGIVADVTLVRDTSGQVIYGYTASLGGSVFRIDFTGGDPSAWTMTRIAALGCADTSSCTANRKFMFAPSVVALNNGSYGLMIGSGDREKPLLYYGATAAVQNYFFMFFDKPGLPAGTATGTWPGNNTCGSAVLCLDSLYPITGSATPTAAELSTKQGWYLQLAPTEQVVTSAITIFGVTTFSTHQPAAVSDTGCTSNLGTTRVYNVNYTNAGSANGTDSRYENVAGDGLPPSPVAGQVTLDNGSTVPFCIGCSKESPLEGKLPTGMTSVVQPKSRLYWYIQK